MQPVLVFSQSCFNGVVSNIANKALILPFAADGVIVGFVEPEGSGGAQQHVRLAGAGSLDTLQKLREIVALERFQQKVNMRRHDDGRVQQQSVAVETQYATLDGFTYIRPSQGSASHTCVEPSLDPTTETPIIFLPILLAPRFGM